MEQIVVIQNFLDMVRLFKSDDASDHIFQGLRKFKTVKRALELVIQARESKFKNLKSLKMLSLQTVVDNAELFWDILPAPAPDVATLPSGLKQDLLKLFPLDKEYNESELVTIIRLADKETRQFDFRGAEIIVVETVVKRARNLERLTSRFVPTQWLQTRSRRPLLKLQHLELVEPELVDKNIAMLAECAPNLLSLKVALNTYSATAESLFLLRKLCHLESVEFNLEKDQSLFYDKTLMRQLMSQILLLLPQLKVAGSKADEPIDDLEKYGHSVPILSSKTLPLEHLIIGVTYFSKKQAKVVPNVKAICIGDNLRCENLDNFSHLQSIQITMDPIGGVHLFEHLLLTYGSRLKTLIVHQAHSEFDFWKSINNCQKLEKLYLLHCLVEDSPPVLNQGLRDSLRKIHYQTDGQLLEGLLPMLTTVRHLEDVKIECRSVSQLNELQTFSFRVLSEQLEKLQKFEFYVDERVKADDVWVYEQAKVFIANCSPVMPLANCTFVYESEGVMEENSSSEEDISSDKEDMDIE